jgi:hypothetical protein
MHLCLWKEIKQLLYQPVVTTKECRHGHVLVKGWDFVSNPNPSTKSAGMAMCL